MSEERGLKRFSGEEEDVGKQLRRWKAWALAKQMTVKDLQKTQRGPWLFTLRWSSSGGLRKTLIGADTLESMEKLLGGRPVVRERQVNSFRLAMVRQRLRRCSFVVGPPVAGEAQLTIDFARCTATVLKDPKPIALHRNGAGQLLLNLVDFPSKDISKEDGDAAIWELLHERFPEKKPHDQMGVDRQGHGDRKAAVGFPKEAHGWIALHCAGLSEEQKAIVKAKTQGKLDLETVSAGSRFCFSSLKATGVKTKRPTSVLLAEDEDLLTDQLAEGESFADVEAFLADYGQGDGAEDAVSETDAAEALAVSWKEKRSEINRLQKSRQFHAADASRRNFRIEFEELKK
ncbi:GIP, partial [Symbiodinium pilosum]